jgi:hypothetical protein
MKNGYLVLMPLFLLAACKRKDDNPIPSNLDFSTYQMYDINAEPIGIHGTGPDDDYQQEDWAPWIYNLFAPLDTVNMAGTAVDTIQFGYFYPNPTVGIQAYYFTTEHPVAFKMALINTAGKVFYTIGFKVPAGQNYIQLSYPRGKIPAGDYRAYFGFSAEGNKFFYRAHGDIGLQ